MVRYVDYLVHAWLLGWVSEGGHSGLILVIIPDNTHDDH